MDGMRQRPRRTASAAFTLVELLVTMAIAAVVMFAVYMLYDTSNAGYRIQAQVADANDELRFALSRLEADISRSGDNATWNGLTGADPAVCYTSPAIGRPLLRVAVRPATGMAVTPDGTSATLTVMGDFWSPGAYPVLSINGDEIVLDAAAHPTVTTAEMEGYFAVGRMLRFVNKGERELYYVIEGFAPSGGGPTGLSPIVTIDEAVPQVMTPVECGYVGFGTNATVNPVGFYRYQVEQDTRDPAANKYDLVRVELDPTAVDEEMAGTRLRAAEYAVDFQLYDFVFAVATGTGDKILGEPGCYEMTAASVANPDDTGRLGALGGGVAPTPEQLRALSVKVSVRTADEDPLLRALPGEAQWPLLKTDVWADRPGVARVVSAGRRFRLWNVEK